MEKQKARWKRESHSIDTAKLGRRRSSSHQDSHWGAAAPNDKATRHNKGVQGTAVDGPLELPAQWKRRRCHHWMHPSYHNEQRAFPPAE